MAEPLLKIEHLTKRYGDDPVLDDLSLDVHKGEVIVILGPSGCGKSTLLRCVNALEEIQGGSVTLRVSNGLGSGDGTIRDPNVADGSVTGHHHTWVAWQDGHWICTVCNAVK